MPTDTPSPRKPDAIRCPRDYPPRKAGVDRDVARNQILGPVLGVKRVASAATHGGRESLVRPFGFDDFATSHYYTPGHPLAGEDRYDWFVADEKFQPIAPVEGHAGEEGRVLIGFLKADPHDTAETREAIQAAYAARIDEHQSSPEFQARLRELGYQAMPTKGGISDGFVG